MIYYYIVSAILLFYFLILGENLYQDSKTTEKLGVKIGFCVVLTLLYRYCWGYYFWGLEYEDSYSFSFLAREFAHSIYTDSFLAEGIVVGSLEEAYKMGQYGGHFITYSVFLSYFVKLFGYSPFLLSSITTLLSFISLYMLSIFPYKREHTWWLPPLIYCSAPIMNVFSNTFLCEPFSCFIILSFIYAYYKQSDFVFILASFFVAILCKRENLILFMLPLYTWLTNYKTHKKEYWTVLCLVIIIAGYFLFIQNVFEIEDVEYNDINVSTFSYIHFTKLYPFFIGTLFSLNLFSIITYVFVTVAILSLYIKCLRSKLQVPIILLFFSFLLIYSFHYRGYYFVHYGQISKFETFRYLSNFYILIPVVLGATPINKVLKYGVLIMALFSIFQTFHLRKYYSNEEWFGRFQDVEKIVSILGDSDSTNKTKVLFTDDILLYQNVCSASFNVCDIRFLDKVNCRNRVEKYVVIKDIETLKTRYQITFDESQYDIVKKLRNGTLYKLRSTNATQ